MRSHRNVQVRHPSKDIALPLLGTGNGITFIRGNKLFELTNHLGNVLATVSDKKLGHSADDSTVDRFQPEVVSAQDYYPFGMLEVGRSGGMGKEYRFGFNGQELDNEIKGFGNSYTAEHWEYDPRIGRRWDMDPINLGGTSPYAAFANNPIMLIDPLGLDTVNSSKRTGVGSVFRHYNPKTNSNFYWDRRASGWEGGGSFSTLEPVVVTATKKRSFTFIHWPADINAKNISILDQANVQYTRRKDAGQPLIQGGESDYYLNNQSTLQRFYQSEQDNRTGQLAALGITAAPVALVGLSETGASYYLYQTGNWLLRNYGVDFAKEVLKEAVANRFQVRNMDWSDVFVSTVTSKLKFFGKEFLIEAINSTNDITVQGGWENSFMSRQSGHNKLLRTTFMDGGFGILKLATGGGLNETINQATLDQLKYEINQRLEQH